MKWLMVVLFLVADSGMSFYVKSFASPQNETPILKLKNNKFEVLLPEIAVFFFPETIL